MRNKILTSIALVAAAACALVLLTRRGDSQSATPQLTVGMYAPTVDFGSQQSRLQYVQGIAKAIESATGIKTTAQVFASLGSLKKAGVDFAIVDGQCYAVNGTWKLLADAEIGGSTSRPWALYSSIGSDMSSLTSKKIAYVETGCKDDEFIDNAMLESEVAPSFWGGRVAKSDLASAVAAVASYKNAEAIFAPVGSAKGLTKVFDTGEVPNPAFVQVNTKLDPKVVSQAQSAVTSYGGGGAISSWAGASKSPYSALEGRMGHVTKEGVFAAPEPVRFDPKDVLIDPTTLDDTQTTGVEQHFEKPPDRLQ